MSKPNLYKSKPEEDLGEDFEAFVENVSPPTLEENELETLEVEITEQEMTTALGNMSNGSAPGPDGIPLEVYKMFWRQLKSPLLHSF